MVVNNVHNNAYSSIVQSLNHLLEFLYSYSTVIWVGRIRALRHIVVHRIIAPVILRLVKLCFINRAIVINRV